MSSVVISLLNKRSYDLKVLTYNTNKLPNINKDKSKSYISKKEQLAFAKQLEKFRRNHKKSFYHKDENIPSEIKKYLPVKAGFYVNWDMNSQYSLRKNIGQLNMVLPEWFFQSDAKGNISSRLEEETLSFIHKNKVSVIPILSNFRNKRFNGDSTLITLKNKASRTKLINNIKTVLDTNDLQGINIDFENLPLSIKPYLLQFSKELYETLHADGYLTTIDIDPSVEGISYKDIAPYYDFIFIMAYNEHYPDSEAGSISSLSFIENALDNAMKEVASEKIVLCVAGYGFDWQKGKTGVKTTYQGLISLARQNEEPLIYNMGQADLSM